jgi:hypothetical protein
MGNDPMNWRRGLFRLWLVFSVLFAIGAVSFNYIKGEFDQLSFKEAMKNDILMVPVDCSLARGAEKTDYIKDINPSARNACWYQSPKFRRLYPEYADLTDDKLIGAKPYSKILGPASQKWDPSPIRAILVVAGIAIGVPRSASIGYDIGLGLCWIFQGA